MSICSLGLHNPKNFITGLSGGLTYQSLWQCGSCGTYLFRAGLEGGGAPCHKRMTDEDRKDLIEYLPPKASKKERKKLKAHIKKAFVQPSKWVDNLF